LCSTSRTSTRGGPWILPVPTFALKLIVVGAYPSFFRPENDANQTYIIVRDRIDRMHRTRSDMTGFEDDDAHQRNIKINNNLSYNPRTPYPSKTTSICPYDQIEGREPLLVPPVFSLSQITHMVDLGLMTQTQVLKFSQEQRGSINVTNESNQLQTRRITRSSTKSLKAAESNKVRQTFITKVRVISTERIYYSQSTVFYFRTIILH
jgi:hypothetical protein